MLIDEYFTQQLEFEKKYGPKTILLMQVGMFFEMYGVNNQTEKIGDLQTITELLNIQLSRRNKAIIENSRSNSLMAGFPISSVKRFINILLSNSYTIILVEQDEVEPTQRKITNIYSPGTYIEDINQADPNNIVAIYIIESSCHKSSNSIFSFGISCIDLSTGNNIIYEHQNIYYEKSAFLEEIYRFIETYNPIEIIVYCQCLEKLKISEIRNKLYFPNRIIHYLESVSPKFFNIDYQNQFLKKIFPEHGMLSPIEFLDMSQKTNVIISYLILLDYAYEHNERIIEKIKLPKNWDYKKHLILYNNSIYQLNIVENSSQSNNQNKECKYKSLHKVIQKTSTNMGKRLLKHRLTNPITNVEELNNRYDKISAFIKSDSANKIINTLSEIIDIDRMHRKISLQILHPYEFLNLSYSYESIVELINLLKSEKLLEYFNLEDSSLQNFKKYINDYKNKFNLREMGKYGLTAIGGSFFNKGHFEKIDNIQQKIDEIFLFFEAECKKLSHMIEANSQFVKLENTEKDGYFLFLTKKRSDILMEKLNNEDKKEKSKDKEKNKYELLKYNGANIKLLSPKIKEYSASLIDLKEEIQIITKDEYLKCLAEFELNYMVLLNILSEFVAEVDFINCGAQCAKIYKYNRPIIQQKSSSSNNASYFSAKEIRHPIIELINEEVNYVSNDLELIHEKCNGILLYGVNGVGKSSLSKAVGCNIVLAQMGYYVAASNFTYYPYTKIFTRINGDDNMFKGQSSFAIEMDELRSILKYSDSRSIVLGDEICKGTEETSALSIVSSSILRFCKNNVNFIMATHFHKLVKIKDIEALQNIKFMHLSVQYDKAEQSIIYGRKLEEGPGDTLYGVEIADFLIQDSEFIKNAKRIRNIILEKEQCILEDKTSNYNSKLYVDKCAICGDNGYQYPLDTHHIKEQHLFEEDDINKDKLANLVVLCKKHHDSVHHGNLEISGYIETTKGKKLIYNNEKESKEESKEENQEENQEENKEENQEKLNHEEEKSNHKKSKKKYNEEQIIIIKKMAEELRDQKQYMKILLLELKKKDIIISTKTVNQICNNLY